MLKKKEIKRKKLLIWDQIEQEFEMTKVIRQTKSWIISGFEYQNIIFWNISKLQSTTHLDF